MVYGMSRRGLCRHTEPHIAEAHRSSTTDTQQKKDQQAAANAEGGNKKKVTAAQLRAQKGTLSPPQSQGF